MHRCLIVSHQTLGSPELLETIRERYERAPTVFHLLVPEHYPPGLTWNEYEVRQEAEAALDVALQKLNRLGYPATGEVGEPPRFAAGDSPVVAVEALLRRDGPHAYDEIIVSTLPRKLSHWLRMDAPARIRRATHLPVTEVVTASEPALPVV